MESEDERIRKELLKEIEFISPRDGETDSEGLILPSYHARIDRYKSYLENQKEQKPAEWSEEDETHRVHLVGLLEEVQKWAEQDGMHHLCIARCEESLSWLKSLRPQPHWKPSEEQMDELDLARYGLIASNDVLTSLYNDLKKL